MDTEMTEATAMRGEAVFTGFATHALDPKRRVTIPSGWRDALGGPKYVFVMADPHEKCLRLLSVERMQAIQARLRAKRFADPTVAARLRVIGQNTEQLPLDVQGRIRISDRLLAFAGITGKIAFVGAVTYGEIWAAEARGAPQIGFKERAVHGRRKKILRRDRGGGQ